ncbi:MAG: phosphoglucosamine mutase, partial [Clostridia bacterium]|nr:phosphoglucosamine mutase [Clostridia bacterium]
MGKYFGTDGIRGVANTELDAALAYRAGIAAAYVLTRSLNRRATFYIGRDTRISGDMLECALSAGICAAGADVISLGVLPTPAVAFLTAQHQVDAGVVISASHNPFEHNGIKIFGSTGYKLTDAQEAEIERYIDTPPADALRHGGDIGRVTHLEQSAADEYIEHITKSAPSTLSGLRILVDCANGAASTTASAVFSRLQADAEILFDQPNGININDGCGSTHLDRLCAMVSA